MSISTDMEERVRELRLKKEMKDLSALVKANKCFVIKEPNHHHYRYRQTRVGNSGRRMVILKCPQCKRAFEIPYCSTHFHLKGFQLTTACSSSCSIKIHNLHLDARIKLGAEQKILRMYKKERAKNSRTYVEGY